jgi:hypothetical protein
MTSDDARIKLQEGVQVKWIPDGTLGIVREKSYSGVRIRWTDGNDFLIDGQFD